MQSDNPNCGKARSRIQSRKVWTRSRGLLRRRVRPILDRRSLCAGPARALRAVAGGAGRRRARRGARLGTVRERARVCRTSEGW